MNKGLKVQTSSSLVINYWNNFLQRQNDNSKRCRSIYCNNKMSRAFQTCDAKILFKWHSKYERRKKYSINTFLLLQKIASLHKVNYLPCWFFWEPFSVTNIAILQILNFVPVSTSEISLMVDEWGGAQWLPCPRNQTTVNTKIFIDNFWLQHTDGERYKNQKQLNQ